MRKIKIEFRKALGGDADALSDLAVRSKGHWGYAPELLERWREGLRIQVEYIENNTVRTIYCDGSLVGFFAIVQGVEEGVLDHLWLLPAAIGKGIGRRALSEIEVVCSQLGIATFLIISDPDAEGFYLKHGAVKVGEVESIPQNSMLPKLRYRISTQ